MTSLVRLAWEVGKVSRSQVAPVSSPVRQLEMFMFFPYRELSNSVLAEAVNMSSVMTTVRQSFIETHNYHAAWRLEGGMYLFVYRCFCYDRFGE